MSFTHYLSDIEGVSIYPIISLIIFFIFFIGLFVWVRKMSKGAADECSNIPLEDNYTIQSQPKNQ